MRKDSKKKNVSARDGEELVECFSIFRHSYNWNGKCCKSQRATGKKKMTISFLVMLFWHCDAAVDYKIDINNNK